MVQGVRMSLLHLPETPSLLTVQARASTLVGLAHPTDALRWTGGVWWRWR
jgi:hypothetical protein